MSRSSSYLLYKNAADAHAECNARNSGITMQSSYHSITSSQHLLVRSA